MIIKGSCDRDRGAFEINAEILSMLTRCTYSFGTRRGTLFAYCEPAQSRLTTPEADTATFRLITKRAAHNFCTVCSGGTSSYIPDSEPDGNLDRKARGIGANARLFECFDSAAAPVQVPALNVCGGQAQTIAWKWRKPRGLGAAARSGGIAVELILSTIARAARGEPR